MRTARPMRRTALLGLLAVALLVEAASHTAGLGAGLLHLVPAFLLALPLLAGRYLGEEKLAELAVARAPGRARRVPRALPAPRRAPRALVARGGSLLAASLGVRGPPAVA